MSTPPKRDIAPGLLAQLYVSSYMGPATFGMRPLLTEPEQLDEWQPDVAIVGCPWDDSTTNRPGARFGPCAVRANVYDPGSHHLDLGVEIFDHLEVVDHGDATVTHGMWEPSRAAMHQRVAEVASRGITPIILGGDHSHGLIWEALGALAYKNKHRSGAGWHADLSRESGIRANTRCARRCERRVPRIPDGCDTPYRRRGRAGAANYPHSRSSGRVSPPCGTRSPCGCRRRTA